MYEQAINHFNEAAKYYKYFWPFHFHRAMAFVCKGDYKGAIEALNRCLETKQEKEYSTLNTGSEFKKIKLPCAEIYLMR